MGFWRISSRNRTGMTLVEVMICLVLVMFAGLSTVAAITYTRLNMELEKQRLAAINYCRQSMEAVQSLNAAYAKGKQSLVPFNQPGISPLDANVEIEYYRMTTDGKVDWATGKLLAPSLEEPVFARVTVSWTPYGSLNRPQEVSMSTILTKGINK